MSNVVERFLRYIQIDTQSDHDSSDFPSTRKQFNLAHMLVKELQDLGLQDAAVDENCYVTATLPANTARPAPTIGWIAHMDTSPDFSGENVHPRLINDYDGKDILLNPEQNIVLSPRDFPELLHYTGQSLIVTDGTTLLGADDKAGIAEIMGALETLIQHPEIKHGTLKIGFTPDEEVGQGASRFDVKKFGADFAFTLDGGPLGELEYENFNAAGARVIVHGRGVHPGYAKNKMINASLVAMEINALLPVEQRPEYTSDYEGFFHLTHITGEIEKAEMGYILRDHDLKKFEAKKILLQNAVNYINHKYGAGTAELVIKEQYRNMREQILPVIHIVKAAEQAMRNLKIEPLIVPVRGGTDGAVLSYMGLPCPNLFTGGHNAHGKYEFAHVETMHKAVDLILEITRLYTSQ